MATAAVFNVNFIDPNPRLKDADSARWPGRPISLQKPVPLIDLPAAGGCSKLLTSKSLCKSRAHFAAHAKTKTSKNPVSGHFCRICSLQHVACCQPRPRTLVMRGLALFLFRQLSHLADRARI